MTDKLTFNDFRARIGDVPTREYYRSLDELSRSEAFDEILASEFPQQALPLQRGGVDRRDFMKLMSASMALAGLAACNRPEQKIVPYVRQPENLVPGKPMYFATAMTLGGVATGVLAESHMGRPTKIEGNPDHPSSLGASDSFMQASILGLYDPDRAQVVYQLGEVHTWSEFVAALVPIANAAKTNGRGLRLLTQTITSPSLGAQIQQVLAMYPGMQWHQWEPVNRDNVREGLRMAFGAYVNAVYHFDKANVVVALDADFTSDGPGHLRYARDFASRRKVRRGTTSMNRLYSIDCGLNSTAAVADHRWAVKPSEVETWARGILAGNGANPAIAAIARDLQKNRGASIVIAGEGQPPVVHALAMAINQQLGNVGSTITITDPLEVQPVNELESLRQLVTDMNSGTVQALIMLGGNPAYDAPADFNFAEALKKVPFRAHLSHYYDETSMLSHWHIPETHYLETWGDARGHDGTVSIQQPLIAPLYNGRAAAEVVGALLGGMDASPYDVVRAYWFGKGANEQSWRQWLNDGVIANSALPARAGAATSAAIPESGGMAAALQNYELHIVPDPNIYDGRFANNGWLQELPKPQSKLCWENFAIVSPATAQAIGFGEGERAALNNELETRRVKVSYRGRDVILPLWIVPGHPSGVVTVTLGYGRRNGGRIASPPDGTPIGADLYPMRFSDALGGGAGATVALTDEGAYPIACTQEHQSLNVSETGGERHIIHRRTFGEAEKHEEDETNHQSMYPPYAYASHAWAMVIDPSVCTGCNGCVVACQSENNIAIVGKTEVHRQRELHWLRIDRYFRGSPENPEIYHQPVPCMQCENAPCEPVCPVEATSHNGEGLNDMTYNRCVGTRYCSNNCPYKVRRFNNFFYADYDTPALKPMRNPDVSIRTRGVMEKCTYCVQRINEAKIEAEKRGGDQRVRDGEVVTACQQACPTDAIVFGDMNDKSSKVAQLKTEPSNYALLAELNTRPRTTYLAVVRNPNPEIAR
ncbi:MAG TPA: TAT-variant-translocated molybdopterin oxidoreductase [Thermoanaerobaculia bacterium]|jgi:molybdopterin-containing oxidoreductase family iron-sulfur binding subunit